MNCTDKICTLNNLIMHSFEETRHINKMQQTAHRKHFIVSISSIIPSYKNKQNNEIFLCNPTFELLFTLKYQSQIKRTCNCI